MDETPSLSAQENPQSSAEKQSPLSVADPKGSKAKTGTDHGRIAKTKMPFESATACCRILRGMSS